MCVCSLCGVGIPGSWFSGCVCRVWAGCRCAWNDSITERSFQRVTPRGAPYDPLDASAQLVSSVARTDHLVVRARIH